MKLIKRLSILVLLISLSFIISKNHKMEDSNKTNKLMDQKEGIQSFVHMEEKTKPRIVTFTKMDFRGIDVGCGSEGDICAVGLDYQLYCYNFYLDTWDLMPLNDEITRVTRVDVDDFGRIYIIADCGIFTLDCYDKWVKLPGTGVDIGVGVNFDVWKIGGESIGKNWGVWKLFCECTCECKCERYCLRFRKIKYNVCEPIVRRRCYWFRADLYGVNVDVFPNGDAAVVNYDHKVFIVDSVTMLAKKLNDSVKAVDVTVGNDGILYVTDIFNHIHKYIPSNNTWVKVTEATVDAFRLCAGPYNLITYVGKFSWIYTSTRYNYLPCIEP